MNGREHVVQHFDRRRIAAQMEEILVKAARSRL